MLKRFILFFIAIITLAIPAIAFCENEVRIVSADATSWIVGNDPSAYTPARIIDGDETTTFQFSTRTTPLGQEYIYFYLEGPSNISTLWIKNGFWQTIDGYDQYIRNSRVKTMSVDFQYSGTNGYSNALTVTLPDDSTRSDWTKIDLGSHARVISVRFLIKDIYEGSKYQNDVCISEVKFTDGSMVSSANLYGLATQKLATRNGPGTQYEEWGTYYVEGQYIRILSRAWDARNSIWWVKCEIPYREEIRVLWTGYKRFDSSTIPLESIPIEDYTNSTGPSVSSGSDSWADAYRQFFISGTYQRYISAVNSEWAEMLNERDSQWDCAALYDLDSNGIPELIIRSDYGIEQADIFTYSNQQITWFGAIGGDNFFQDIFYYRGSNHTGLFAALGGPVMDIRNYKLDHGRLSCTEIAETIINSEGDETIGIRMNVDDSALYALLYKTFVTNQNTAVSLQWYRASNLQNRADWLTLFNSTVR